MTTAATSARSILPAIVPSVLLSALTAALLLVALSAPLAARSVEPATPSERLPTSPHAVGSGDVPLLALSADVQALADDFNLLPAQRALIGMILASAAPEALEIATGLADRHRAMNDELLGDPVDPVAIETLAAAQGQGLADLTALGIATLIDVRAVLSDDQRLLLDGLRAALEMRLAEIARDLQAVADRRTMSRVAMRRAGPGSGDALTDAGSALGLTPEQRAAIEAVLDAATPEALAIAADLAANRNALMDLVRTSPDDAAAIDGLVAIRAGLYETAALLRADLVLQVREILTEDQLALIVHLRRALQDRLADRIGGF